jgi:hypothetical protein
MEDEIIDEFLSRHQECFDRFTFDKVFRFLLVNNYSHEDAKDFILFRCMFSASVLQERIYNNYYKKISVSEKISSDLQELRNEIFNANLPKYRLN